MGTTDDRNDPALNIIDPETNMQMSYLVLSDEERALGFVRPVRTSYVHDEDLGGCGTMTEMGRRLAETYARDPHFYGATYCAGCKDHFRVGEDGQFYWRGTTEKVGT